MATTVSRKWCSSACPLRLDAIALPSKKPQLIETCFLMDAGLFQVLIYQGNLEACSTSCQGRRLPGDGMMLPHPTSQGDNYMFDGAVTHCECVKAKLSALS